MLFTLGSPLLVGIPAIDISGFLGSMFTGRRWAARMMGTSILMSAGFGLAILCTYLWQVGVGDPSLKWGLIFGGSAGILALLLLSLLLPRVPRRSQLCSAKSDTVGAFLWLGFLVYGLVVASLA
jgi:hypothetical protein